MAFVQFRCLGLLVMFIEVMACLNASYVCSFKLEPMTIGATIGLATSISAVPRSHPLRLERA